MSFGAEQIFLGDGNTIVHLLLSRGNFLLGKLRRKQRCVSFRIARAFRCRLGSNARPGGLSSDGEAGR